MDIHSGIIITDKKKKMETIQMLSTDNSETGLSLGNKKHETLIRATIWIDLENMMLSEKQNKN